MNKDQLEDGVKFLIHMCTEKKGLKEINEEEMPLRVGCFFFTENTVSLKTSKWPKKSVNLNNCNKALPNQDPSKFKITELFNLEKTFKSWVQPLKWHCHVHH